jgi:uncharacterized protein YoxC
VLDPLFWLGLSILLVAVSLTAVLVAALPALRELARAARSAEKLFDTLSRELPPTLESIRLTGMEITDLKDDVSEGVQSAGRVVQQVDQGLSGVRQQARQAKVTTRSIVSGIRAAWRTFQTSAPRSVDRLPPGEAQPLNLGEEYPEDEYRHSPTVSRSNTGEYETYDSYDDYDNYDNYDDYDESGEEQVPSRAANGDRYDIAASESPAANDPKVLQQQNLPRAERRD